MRRFRQTLLSHQLLWKIHVHSEAQGEANLWDGARGHRTKALCLPQFPPPTAPLSTHSISMGLSRTISRAAEWFALKYTVVAALTVSSWAPIRTHKLSSVSWGQHLNRRLLQDNPGCWRNSGVGWFGNWCPSFWICIEPIPLCALMDTPPSSCDVEVEPIDSLSLL